MNYLFSSFHSHAGWNCDFWVWTSSGLAQWKNSWAYIQEHVGWNSSYPDRLIVVSQIPSRQQQILPNSSFIIIITTFVVHSLANDSTTYTTILEEYVVCTFRIRVPTMASAQWVKHQGHEIDHHKYQIQLTDPLTSGHKLTPRLILQKENHSKRKKTHIFSV